MTQALVTFVAPLAVARVDEAASAIDALGNPARPDVAAALDRLDGEAGVHFASMHAIRSYDGARGYLILEASADGTEAAATARLAAALEPFLRPIFALATDWHAPSSFRDYLLAHQLKLSNGLFGHAGVAFPGTPGITVGRIRADDALASSVETLLAAQTGGRTSMERLAALRETLRNDAELRHALAPQMPPPPYKPPGQPALITAIALAGIWTYLWPVVLLIAAWTAWSARLGPGAAFAGFWQSALLALIAVLIAAGVLYLRLRRAEARDWLDERIVDRRANDEMFARENHYAQNHMVSITQRKPGFLRWLTSRAVFWLIGQLVGRFYRPGFLGTIGTIHFARWVTPAGSPDVIFFSNYDASWESYLEDFITRAHLGLTGVWSNSIGFPRTENLLWKGATDGERFKRYARHSMVPTRFWYCAYPTLTTNAIRRNASLRQGLSGAMTEDEAAEFLSLFGSGARPADMLVSSDIQSLVFGGLKFLKHGVCLIATLPAETSAARAWLAALAPHIAYSDGRRFAADNAPPAVITLGLGAPALSRLGLGPEAVSSFPYAFLEGMATEARGRILGDVGESAPERWRWGQGKPEAALLVYGKDAAALASLRAEIEAACAAHGAPMPLAIPLKTLDHDKREPFGFVDGISQPVIRGTYKGLRNADPIHLCEPGEFILGYPDNRGNRPPGPVLAATDDPDGCLPLVGAVDGFGRTMAETPRDLGRDGSFLVIRELETDVAGFHAYCAAEADRLKARLPPPYHVTAEFIAAKMVGRWQDGSSLVRHPYAPPGAGHGASLSRPSTRPDGASSIEKPHQGHGDRADNDFLFGVEDPEAVRCPFGSHIRRTNPRDSLDPGSDEQIGITNRHRILRVGRRYEAAGDQREGLLFMCLNGDLERQFEFVQQSWARNPSFMGLSGERDPILGDGAAGTNGFTVPSRDGPMCLKDVPGFVTVRGGGYFFLPGRRLVGFLSG